MKLLITFAFFCVIFISGTNGKYVGNKGKSNFVAFLHFLKFILWIFFAESSEGDSCDKDDQIHVRNPNDCASFLQCEPNGKYAKRPCPGGLYFSDNDQVCVAKEKVMCSKSGSGYVQANAFMTILLILNIFLIS